MGLWNKKAVISDADSKAREAAFEAQMLAMLSDTEKEQNTVKQSNPTMITVPPAAQAPAVANDGIQISITQNGRTTTYRLADVPVAIRRSIVNDWLK